MHVIQRAHELESFFFIVSSTNFPASTGISMVHKVFKLNFLSVFAEVLGYKRPVIS